MIVGLNATQARAKSTQDSVMFEKSYTIMKQIIAESSAGEYETTITNATTMTSAQPTHVVTGTVADPIIAPGETIIIQDVTIVLGTTGTTVNAVIADINDAGVTGVVASKTADEKLVITITLPQDDWDYMIGAGTANANLGISVDSGSAQSPTGKSYFEVWQGVVVDRAKQQQIDGIVRYFENLGYKIQLRTNTVSGKTFDWYVFW